MLSSTSGDIHEAFLAKHGLVCNQLGRFSFSSRTFRPEEKNRKSQNPGGGGTVPPIGQANSAPQTANVRTHLRGKYAAAAIFQVHEAHVPRATGDQLDLRVNPGDLVGVIVKKDPTGDANRWFVDNGSSQGFVPSRVLHSIGDLKAEVQHKQQPAHQRVQQQHHQHTAKMNPVREAPKAPPPNQLSHHQHPPPPPFPPQPESPGSIAAAPPGSVTAVAEVHAYDDVAPDEVDPVDVGTEEEDPSAAVPVRKAPPVPSNAVQQIQDVDGEEDQAEAADDDDGNAMTPTNPKEEDHASQQQQQQGGGEEEVPAERDASQDLSPIYEEIHGGTRSTVSTNSSGSSGQTGTAAQAAATAPTTTATTFTTADSVDTSTTDDAKSEQPLVHEVSQQPQEEEDVEEEEEASASEATESDDPRNMPTANSEEVGRFYYSQYSFTATDATMLTVGRGQARERG